MAYLTKDQVKQIINNAPQGTSPAGIVAALRKQGHQLEGYDITPQGDQNAPEEKETFTEKAAGFLDSVFGGGKLGELAGTYAAKWGLTGLSPEQRENVSLNVPSGKELLGDVIKTGTTIASAALPAAKTFKAAAGAGSLLGSAFGAGEALREEAKPGEVLESAAKGAGAGALAGLAGQALVRGLEALATKAPRALAQIAVGKYQTPNELQKELVGKSVPIAETLVKEAGVPVTDARLYSHALSIVDEAEKKIQKVIEAEAARFPAKSRGIISTRAIISSLNELTRKYRNVLGEGGDVALEQVKNSLREKGPYLRAGEALQLKRDITSVFAKLYEKADPNLAQKQEAYRAVADFLRKRMAQAIPEIAELSETQSKWIKVADTIERKLVAKGKQGVFGLTDAILGAGFGGDITSAVTALAGRRLTQSTPLLLGGARVLERAVKPTQAVVRRVGSERLSKLGRYAITRAAGSFVKPNNNTNY